MLSILVTIPRFIAHPICLTVQVPLTLSLRFFLCLYLILSTIPFLCLQSEPELERLKLRLQELKEGPKGLEGTSRRQAAQRTDAALKELLDVEEAFREDGPKLQGLYDLKQRTEYGITTR